MTHMKHTMREEHEEGEQHKAAVSECDKGGTKCEETAAETTCQSREALRPHLPEDMINASESVGISEDLVKSLESTVQPALARWVLPTLKRQMIKNCEREGTSGVRDQIRE